MIMFKGALSYETLKSMPYPEFQDLSERAYRINEDIEKQYQSITR